VEHEEYAHKIETLVSVWRDDFTSHALFCAAGLASETGEILDVLLKAIRYGEEIDLEQMHEELGDVLFYFSRLVELFGASLEKLRTQNIIKLENRHGST